MRLEDLREGVQLKGILQNQVVTVIQVKWFGKDAVEITYKDQNGRVSNELLYRDRQEDLQIVKGELSWRFTADGNLFRLVSEAYRIRMAYLIDRHLAVHSSFIDPLPHQIVAVYDKMLSRQPLRYLLADDPGAGKTIMAGLLIKELMVRGDVQRCLICAPGNLVEQWQDELDSKFQLRFHLLSNQTIDEFRRGNPFSEKGFWIGRLDHLSRNEEIQTKLKQVDWDFIIVDEAHKMSASFFGGEVKETKRYKLGKLLSKCARHFLMMTATPHNGKEEDFQLFLSLIDLDRFEGRFRSGVHKVEIDDIMSRRTKEQLLKFDGTPLFPERKAYTVTYQLSAEEQDLYEAVSDYVREQWNRIEQLKNNEKKRRTVGFALTILQRRLASSPEAIYQSLRRRREKLEEWMKAEMRGASRGRELAEHLDDLYDLLEAEEIENKIVSQATSARTIRELAAEIEVLKELEKKARNLRRSGRDKKWEELSLLLQSDPSVTGAHYLINKDGKRRKLVIFTEHKDTLHYLADKIRTLLGQSDAVVMIHGSMPRDERRKAQERFNHDPDVFVLIATDAAGEGINLHRAAHLMVNYDLPWNPNRLEQRFGRIHRIGQQEVCHLWNLVSVNTREGEVFARLLDKLSVVNQALNGAVFDILGKIFQGNRLRDLMIEAIRYGDRANVKQRLYEVVDEELDQEHLRELLYKHALVSDTMDTDQVQSIREEMERAAARRLQPHFIASFFLQAFQLLGGTIRERESRRFEIVLVPQRIRNRAKELGNGLPILNKYKRVCFDKQLVHVKNKPSAELLYLGHPLFDAVVDLILEQYHPLLKQGSILVDEKDESHFPRLLIYFEHMIQDGFVLSNGERRTVSKRMQFLELSADGAMTEVGYAPFLDYRPLHEAEEKLIPKILKTVHWANDKIEEMAVNYAVQRLVPQHYKEVALIKKEKIAKVRRAVRERLLKEIQYWDQRAIELMQQEREGKVNARLNSQNARKRADELHQRLEKRMKELDMAEHLSPRPPVVIGGALIVPAGLLQKLQRRSRRTVSRSATARQAVEKIAMDAVMEIEQKWGFVPKDVSSLRMGYDIESKDPLEGNLRFLEVKGRVAGATTVTVTRNEILTALNQPEAYWLVVVEIEDGKARRVFYIPKPFQKEPDFTATSVNYNLQELINKGEAVLCHIVES